MTPEQLLNLLINGGGLGVLVWIVVKGQEELKRLRDDYKEQAVWTQNLVMFLLSRNAISIDDLPRGLRPVPPVEQK